MRNVWRLRSETKKLDNLVPLRTALRCKYLRERGGCGVEERRRLPLVS